MRVFVTGASGFIGSIVVKNLIAGGHQVLGLARSEASAMLLGEMGVQVHRGDLQDVESLRSGAAVCDGVIHTGFIHDFSRFRECCETDKRAIEAMGAVLAGSGRPLIISSGTGRNVSGEIRTENEGIGFRSPAIPRMSEDAAEAVAQLSVPVSIVRLPPSVHGVKQQGLVTRLIATAQ